MPSWIITPAGVKTGKGQEGFYDASYRQFTVTVNYSPLKHYLPELEPRQQIRHTAFSLIQWVLTFQFQQTVLK